MADLSDLGVHLLSPGDLRFVDGAPQPGEVWGCQSLGPDPRLRAASHAGFSHATCVEQLVAANSSLYITAPSRSLRSLGLESRWQSHLRKIGRHFSAPPTRARDGSEQRHRRHAHAAACGAFANGDHRGLALSLADVGLARVRPDTLVIFALGFPSWDSLQLNDADSRVLCSPFGFSLGEARRLCAPSLYSPSDLTQLHSACRGDSRH